MTFQFSVSWSLSLTDDPLKRTTLALGHSTHRKQRQMPPILATPDWPPLPKTTGSGTRYKRILLPANDP
jgi:hypothetical protein